MKKEYNFTFKIDLIPCLLGLAAALLLAKLVYWFFA